MTSGQTYNPETSISQALIKLNTHSNDFRSQLFPVISSGGANPLLRDRAQWRSSTFSTGLYKGAVHTNSSDLRFSSQTQSCPEHKQLCWNRQHLYYHGHSPEGELLSRAPTPSLSFPTPTPVKKFRSKRVMCTVFALHTGKRCMATEVWALGWSSISRDRSGTSTQQPGEKHRKNPKTFWKFFLGCSSEARRKWRWKKVINWGWRNFPCLEGREFLLVGRSQFWKTSALNN